MFQIVLTQNNTFIIGDVARLLGIIMNALFEFISMFGIHNIGLAIILFTFIVKLLMFPLTIKQQKFSKISSIMNPEIQAIQKKYKDKKDQESMLRMNEETKLVYEKYGTSPTGGCLQLIIQMPILFALWRVISNIPAYVSSVKDVFLNIVDPLIQQEGYLEKIGTIGSEFSMDPGKFDFTQSNYIIDLLYKFGPNDWEKLTSVFPNITNVIIENSEKIINMNRFIGGINLAEAPGFALTPAIVIPILAGLLQWVSTRLISSTQPAKNSNDESTMASSMKMMNTTMPIMSAIFCVSMPTGLGIYWVASSGFQILQQLLINVYFNRIDMEDLIKKNVDKANKKRAKKGLAPQKVISAANVNTKNINTTKEKLESQQKKYENEEEKLKNMKESTEYYNKGIAKSGSLSSKANMVQQYNEKHKK